MSVKNELIPLRQLFNTLILRSRTVGSVPYTLTLYSFGHALSALVELSTRYIALDTTT